MRNRTPRTLWLSCVLALCGCGTAGKAVKQPDPLSCPKLPLVPASLMQPPQTEQKARGELFKPPQSVTPRSPGSKPF